MKQQGFTLIELLVVIAIIAAMAGVAMVAIPDNNPRDGITREAQRFSDQFAIMQDRASAEQRVYGLIVNGNGFEFHVVTDWDNSGGFQPPKPSWEEVEQFDWQVDIAVNGRITSNASEPTVYLTPDGFYQPEFELQLSNPPRCSGADIKLTGNGYNPPQVQVDEC